MGRENLNGELVAKQAGKQEKLAGLGVVPPGDRSPHEG